MLPVLMWSGSLASRQPCLGKSFPSKGVPCRVQLRWRALRVAVASVAPWWSLALTFRRGSALRASAEQREGIEGIERRIEPREGREGRREKERNEKNERRRREGEQRECKEVNGSETATLEAMAMGAKQLWCSVVINLARRPDRRLQLAHVLAEANAEVLARLLRVDAVDGQKLNLEDLEEKERILDYITADALRIAQEAKQIGAHTIVHKDGELVKFHDHLTEGGIACAMSHYKALKTVAEHPTAKWALILEDDIETLVSDVHLKLESIISRLPPSWDALFVGYHGGVLQGTGLGGTDTQQEQTRAEFELQIDEMRRLDGIDGDNFQGSVEPRHETDIPVLRMYSPLYGLYAWVVRKEAAKRLLEQAFPVPGQVDHALSLWLVQQGNSFKVAPRHMLFYSPKSEVGMDSDIQTMMHLDQLLADPGHCEEYMNFINTHQSAENPQGSAMEPSEP